MMKKILPLLLIWGLCAAFGFGQCPPTSYTASAGSEVPAHLGGDDLLTCFDTDVTTSWDVVVNFPSSPWSDHIITLDGVIGTVQVTVLNGSCGKVVSKTVSAGPVVALGMTYNPESFKVIISGTDESDVVLRWSGGAPVAMEPPVTCGIATAVDPTAYSEGDDWYRFDALRGRSSSVSIPPLSPGLYIGSQGRLILVQ